MLGDFREAAGPQLRGRRCHTPAGHLRVAWPAALHQAPSLPLPRRSVSARARKPVNSRTQLQAAQEAAAPPLSRPGLEHFAARFSLGVPCSPLPALGGLQGFQHAGAPQAPGAAQFERQPRGAEFPRSCLESTRMTPACTALTRPRWALSSSEGDGGLQGAQAFRTCPLGGACLWSQRGWCRDLGHKAPETCRGAVEGTTCVLVEFLRERSLYQQW